MSNEIGTYRKGDDVRVASTPSEAVALSFEGYKRETAESVADGADYRELQAQAKELGIAANQSKGALAEAIANHVPEDAPTGSVGGPDFPEPQSLLDGPVAGDAA